MPGSFASSDARRSITDKGPGTRGSGLAMTRRSVEAFVAPKSYHLFRRSSLLRSPLPYPSKGKLEREIEPRQPAGQLAHLGLRLLLRLLLGVGERDDDEVLEHLRIRGIDDRGIDLHPLNLAGATDVDVHHASTGSAGDGELLEILLDLLKLALHLLRLLQDLHEVAHRSAGEGFTKLGDENGCEKSESRQRCDYSMTSRSSASIAAPSVGSRLRKAARRSLRTISSVSRVGGVAARSGSCLIRSCRT